MNRTKHYKNICICVFLIGMFTCLVSGCGNTKNKEIPEAADAAAVGNEIVDAETADSDILDEETVDEKTVDEEIVDEAEAVAEGNIDEYEDIIDESVTIDFGICNNNAHFIRSGDNVYFRMPDIRDLQDTALWGEYSDNLRFSHDLMRYSIVNSQLDTLLRDCGSGIMGIGGDYLYFKDVEFNNDIECEKLSSIDLVEDEPSYNEICLGDDLVGVTPDGRYAIALSYTYPDTGNYVISINVYEQTEYMQTYDMEDFHEIAGITNDSVFYCTTENLMQLDIATGDRFDLGKLPEAEYGRSEVQQIEVIDNDVYLGLGFYDGTGHFYCDGYYITAEIGVEDSLSSEQINNDSMDSDYEGSEDYVPFYVKDGKQVSTSGIPGTAYIGYTDGAIGYFDDQGKKVEVAKGFETIYDDTYTCMIDVELAELVGDKIFFIKNTNIHVPDEDIGWRTAYMRIRSEFYMVDIATKEMECIADIKADDYESYKLPQ